VPASNPTPGAALSHRTVLALAIPVMLSSLSTPLTGVVATAAVGRIPGAAPIGAVAAGSLIFDLVFWAFGFLRMGTTGLTAQALGAKDAAELSATLGRALLCALAIGMGLILLQWPIRATAFALLGAGPAVELLARQYFDVRIWAAPATLANYAILGWLIGLGRTKLGLVVQLVLNITNMLLALLLVLVLQQGVPGAAAATVLAEYIAAAVGLGLALRHTGKLGGAWSLERLLSARALRRMLGVNLDIMIRSLALITVFLWFTGTGARLADVTLAANAVLMHLVALSAFFLDGLAFATETLVGQAVGARLGERLTTAARLTTAWAAGIAAVLCLVLIAAGVPLIELLTRDPDVRLTAQTYLPWAAGVPLLGVWAWQLDGIFIGATRTAEMRTAMLQALVLFLAAWWLLRPLGNHGLWAALYVSYLARTATLLRYYPRVLQAARGAPA
jgi:MATE family multidrug resistance protein